MRRVVVTGMGMVTPVGRDLESTWSALQEGRSGVGPISLFDAETFPTRIAAEVEGFPAGRLPSTTPTRWDEHCRNTPVRPRRGPDGHRRLGPARDEARPGPDAGSASTWAPARGSRTSPGSSSWSTRRRTAGKVDTAEFTRLGLDELHPIREAEQEPGTPAGHLASALRCQGARTPTA